MSLETATGSSRLRQSEVEHLDRAVFPNLYVRGFEIAMNDPLRVRGFERFGNLLRDRQRLFDRNRPLREAIGERRSLDQLHTRAGRRRSSKP